jgi:hypothetical protein
MREYADCGGWYRLAQAEMTLSDEARRPVDRWVKEYPRLPCKGAARQALLAHLANHLPNKTQQQLNDWLNFLLRKTRGIIVPENTPKVYNPRALGTPTNKSKEVVGVRNAINNPIRSAAVKRKRREEALAMLAEKGHADHILPEEEVEVLVDEILSKPMPEFYGDSIIDLLDETEKNGLEFSLNVGFTVQQIPKEAFPCMGRRGANLPRKRDGEIPRNRPMLLRGDKTLPEEKRHFTAKQCQDELHMKYVQVNFTELKLNAHLLEDAADQNAVLPPGRPAVAGGGHGAGRDGQAARRGRGV